MRTKLRFAVLFTVSLAASGCGKSGDRVAVSPVSGKVLYRGAPAEGARVVLFATEQQGANIPIPSGEVQADGAFRLTSYTQGDGAPAGTYKATVTWPEPIPEGVNKEQYSPPDRLGNRYSDPDRSELNVTVTEGANTLEPFELE